MFIFFLAVYLAYILTFFPPFLLACLLEFYLASIPKFSDILCGFYCDILAGILFLASILAFSIWYPRYSSRHPFRTLASFHSISGISSDVSLPDILSDLRFGILSGNLSDILNGMAFVRVSVRLLCSGWVCVPRLSWSSLCVAASSSSPDIQREPGNKLESRVLRA